MAQSSLRSFDSEKKRQMTFRLYEMTTRKGGWVMQQVLEWGISRRPAGQSFIDYLSLEKNLSRREIRRNFTSNQREKMEKDKLDDFDISLLYLCIQYGCDGVKPPKSSGWIESPDTLEYYLTSVKNFRNAFIHEAFEVDDSNFLSKTEELRDMLDNTLKKAAEMYNIDQQNVEDILQELSDDINKIRDEPLDLSVRCNLDFDKLRQIVNDKGKLELKKRYRDMSSIEPASNLLQKYIKAKLRIDKVYTKLLIEENSTPVPLEGLLALVERRQNQSQKGSTALLVEGPAGVGKTTLTRKLISEWASNANTMENLQDYEFVILFECRAREIQSLSQLLQSLMPGVGKTVQKECLVECIQDNRLLFIVDGLDELNPSSKQVYIEILKLGDFSDITVLCTTRPNRVADFKRLVPENFNTIHVHVRGIAEKDREEFVNNYSQAIKSKDEERDFSGLFHYLSRKESRLQDHWRFPFNLVCVTILWLLDPDAVNRMTTATELFLKTHELCQRKLTQRLFDHEKTWNWDFPEVKAKMDKFLQTLYEEALINHCCDDTVLPSASIQRLRDTCLLLDLPAAEILSAFLIQTTSLSDEFEEKYSFPHKGIQDFFSALYVMDHLIADELDILRIISGFKTVLSNSNVPPRTSQCILQKNNEVLKEFNHKARKATKSIKSVLDETLQTAKYKVKEDREVKLDLAKWQNILIHLTGLLYLEERTVGEGRSEELVALLKGTGIKDNSQWLNLLSEVKCEATVSKCVARAMALRGNARITDPHVAAYASVLPHSQPSSVEIQVASNPRDVPRLTELMMTFLDKTCAVKVELHHDFRYPKDGGSFLDGILRQILQKPSSKILKLKGQLSGATATTLPRSLQELQLSVVNDDHYSALRPSLSSLPGRLPGLKGLLLHVAADVGEASLQPLPEVDHLGLIFDHVKEDTVEWACRVSRALQPGKGPREIRGHLLQTPSRTLSLPGDVAEGGAGVPAPDSEGLLATQFLFQAGIRL
ncbi:uncharacterized protein LOC122248088 isoform X2 [Penaeus japonicus]|uniref:uncharacterized protein LOC122248088 isoform X2 n=1 Tax=Penaeus japonicus TaxID=27405 RepID=UPI001C70B772|nr:uncharacterized protein LOC122248088 isoform X2 [Penaeus japonicus]